MTTLPVLLFVTLAAQAPLEIQLWPDGVPGAPATALTEHMTGAADKHNRSVRDVHVPTITVYRPTANATGKAVVICPGGGYRHLALDKEGHDIARWLVDAGHTGVVLKYRHPRPEGHVYGHEAPLADARRALELVRARADEWKLTSVGIMGFSAGGHLAASASVQLDEQRPDFTVLVYPVVSMETGVTHNGSRANLLGADPPVELVRRFSSELQVTADTPPAFLVHTSDDFVKVENSLLYYVALRAAGVSAALHVFARGGHGYAMRKPEMPVGAWPELLRAWLQEF